MAFTWLWAAEKPETGLLRVDTPLEETSPSELWVKTQQIKFVMHKIPSAHRSFLNSCCASTLTHIPISYQPNVDFGLQSQAELQRQVEWPQASFCSPVSPTQALK